MTLLYIHIQAKMSLNNNTEATFFIESIENAQWDANPIVLLDSSGSTSSVFESTSKSIFSTYKDVLKKILRPEQTSIYLAQWSSSFKSNGLIELNSLGQIKQHESGSTNLDCALNFDKTFCENKSLVEIYILTDGECGGGDVFVTKLKELFKVVNGKLHIYIVTLTDTECDYKTTNYDYGTQIYNIILQNSLSKNIKKFISFNNLYWETPYINLSNPEYHDGFIPYLDKYFSIMNLGKFMEWIDGEIKLHYENFDELLKISHNLVPTILHLSKNKSLKIQSDMIRMFAELFEDTPIQDDVLTMLQKCVQDYNQGVVSSYQNYRDRRNKLFENAQITLLENVSEATSSMTQKHYVSFIVNDTIITFSPNQVQEQFQIYNIKYMNACASVENSNIPVLPTNTKTSVNADTNTMKKHHFGNQCIRQWIRTIYSARYGTYSSDDFLLYMFLTDFVRVRLSPSIPSDIIQYYRNLAFVILDRNRFQSGGKQEITFLLEGNHPQPNMGLIDEIYKIFAKCIENAQIFKDLKFTPMVLWWAIVLSLNNKKLEKVQWNYCEKEVWDFVSSYNDMTTFEPNKFLEFVSNLIQNVIGANPHIKYYDYSQYDLSKPDFYDFVTLDENKDDVGYQINKHILYGKKYCTSKYVICESTWKELEGCSVNCPLCQKSLTQDDFTWINMLEQAQLETAKPTITITDKLCETKCVGVKMLNEYDKTDLDILYKFDDLNWDDGLRYVIDDIDYCQNIMNKYNFTTMRTSKEFSDIIKNQYKFLSHVNWNNLLLAGGFCRSILLAQPVSDLDFFIYGFDTNEEFCVKMLELRNNIISGLKKQILSDNVTKLYLLELYKKNNSVYEILVIKPNSELKKKLNSCEITNENVENFIQGLDVMVKIQIVLSSNKSINSIFENFDIDASCVGWNGQDLLFNIASYNAYKYMINIWNAKKYDKVYYNTRVIKYFNYGFKIGFGSNAKINNKNCSDDVPDSDKSDESESDNSDAKSDISKLMKGLGLGFKKVNSDKNYMNVSKVFKIGSKSNSNSGLYEDIADMGMGKKVLENTFKYIKYVNADKQNIFYTINAIELSGISEINSKLAYDDIKFVSDIFFELKKSEMERKLFDEKKQELKLENNNNDKIILKFDSDSDSDSNYDSELDSESDTELVSKTKNVKKCQKNT